MQFNLFLFQYCSFVLVILKVSINVAFRPRSLNVTTKGSLRGRIERGEILGGSAKRRVSGLVRLMIGARPDRQVGSSTKWITRLHRGVPMEVPLESRVMSHGKHKADPSLRLSNRVFVRLDIDLFF